MDKRMMHWEIYSLGDVISLDQNEIVPEPFGDYKQIKLRLYQRGVELREVKKGNELLSKQFLAKNGQFIISKIDARNGAMGIVPLNLDGAVVTADFLLFKFNDSLLDPNFFELYTRTPLFINDCKNCSEGSTNRVRLKLDKFLKTTIALPSLKEQRSIIDQVKSVSRKTNIIEQERVEQEKEIQQLLYSEYISMTQGVPVLPISQVAPIVRRPAEIVEEKLYPELGIRSFGKGTFHKPALSGIEVGTKKLFQIKTGDLLFSNVFAWEGAIAIAKGDDNDRYGSHRFISCVANEDKVLPEFLCYHFLTPKGLEVINICSPGGAGRNKTLGIDKLMNIKVPVPPLERQREFVSLLHKVEQIKQINKEQERELSEILPALLDKAFKGELMYDTPKADYLSEDKGQTSISMTLPEKNDDLELAMIVALMESRLGNTYGEVGIQKTVFNIEAFNPVLNRKYDFVNYHYGTYSAELKETIKANPFLGKKMIKGNEVFTLSANHKKNILNAISDKANKDFILAVNSILDLYTTPFIGKHTDKIELLNTVTKLIIDLQTIDVDIIYDKMKQWEIKQQGFKTKADKFSYSDTSKTINLLEFNGLVDRLLSKESESNT